MASAHIQTPGFVTGERMSREEFIARWEALPGWKQAELIEGIVYVPSPVSLEHGRFEGRIATWLNLFATRNPGCEVATNTTWYMLESAPQPDVAMWIAPEYGGQSSTDGKYGQGAPELVVEICLSSTEVDFGPKKALYQRAGVREYITIETFFKKLIWRVLEEDGYREIAPDADGIFRSPKFAGLWLDADAFWKNDGPRVAAVLEQGLAASRQA